MKDLFFEYYPIPEDQIPEIWNKCLFSFDTNVLLNLYRYTDQTRNKFFEIIEKLDDRNILTYQTAFEFQKNRLSTISGQAKAYDSLTEFFDKKFKEIENELNRYKKHTYIQSTVIRDQYEKALKKINKGILKLKEEHPDWYQDDQIRNRISDLFSGKVTNPFDEKRLSEIYKLGKIRYEKETPPGYEDLKEKKDKDENSLYGDLIIWNQIMEISKEKALPIVFVTDDLKDDWWYRFNGKTIGPRPELLKEFKINTEQQILIYNADSFLSYASEYTGITIAESIVKEIEELREKDERSISSAITQERIRSFAELMRNQATRYSMNTLPDNVSKILGRNIYNPISKDWYNIYREASVKLSEVMQSDEYKGLTEEYKNYLLNKSLSSLIKNSNENPNDKDELPMDIS